MDNKYIWIIAISLLVLQGSWIFFDASKQGRNKWVWGFFGLLNVPSSLIIYLIITRYLLKTKVCPHCHYEIRANSKYCGICGKAIED